MNNGRVSRVLMTADTVGGVWTFSLELASALADHDVEVILAALGGFPSAEQRSAASRVPRLQLVPSDFKLEWMDDPWNDVESSGSWLLSLERQFQPDVVHLNSYGHGTLPWQAPVVLTAHSCVLSWWAAVKREPLPALWNRYQNEVACSVKSVDVLAAPSRAMLKTIEENYGVDLPPSLVIPNGRDSAAFRQGPKANLILSAGRLWDEAKNIAAVARVAPRLPWPVYVAGENRHPNGSAARINGCRQLGSLPAEALAGWYAAASIYTLPARYEPFGFSALEAALSGCALVLGDIDSLREVWDGAAIFVPPDSDGALETALSRLIANTALRQEMARRATDRALWFAPERMAAGYLETYRQVSSARRLTCAS